MARKTPVKPHYGSKKDPVADCTKPSELIRIAVKDLEQVEADKENYRVDMGAWHRRLPKQKKCMVCFAGAVMAMEYVKDPSKEVDPWGNNFSDITCSRLGGLNDIRNGNVRGYVSLFYNHVKGAAAKMRSARKKLDAALPQKEDFAPEVEVVFRNPKNKIERTKFRAEMAAIAATLESAGL